LISNLIPGVGFAKILIVLFVVTSVFAGYKFAVGFVADYKETQKEIVRVSIESAERQTMIGYMEKVATIKDQFQDDKIVLQEELITSRQSNLDDQEDRIANMGTADHMEVVAELDNGFSKGSDRLTLRAQRATEIITERIEKKTRHETLYSD
jgi:hypothetical protein